MFVGKYMLYVYFNDDVIVSICYMIVYFSVDVLSIYYMYNLLLMYGK